MAGWLREHGRSSETGDGLDRFCPLSHRNDYKAEGPTSQYTLPCAIHPVLSIHGSGCESRCWFNAGLGKSSADNSGARKGT